MNEQQIKTIIDSPEEFNSEEDSLRSMLCDFYNRGNRLTIIWVWGYSLMFLAITIISAVLFFKTDQTKFQIMYAAVFVCSTQVIIHAKIVYWQTMHRNRITREVKRLELRIAELAEIVKNK